MCSSLIIYLFIQFLIWVTTNYNKHPQGCGTLYNCLFCNFHFIRHYLFCAFCAFLWFSAFCLFHLLSGLVCNVNLCMSGVFPPFMLSVLLSIGSPVRLFIRSACTYHTSFLISSDSHQKCEPRRRVRDMRRDELRTFNNLRHPFRGLF